MKSNASLPQERSENVSAKRTVVYIEDNTTIRQLVRYIMEMHPDISLMEAETGTQGLAIIKQCQPDLILLDLHLPDMDGFTLFSLLQNDPMTVNIPVVALSGSAAPADIQRGKAIGFKRFLAKPINVKEFNSTLSTILG
ncbi:MAG: response regulator [Desulfocapsaceae bacterium]|nr:response regulator [Desulfocapsaceae bacterium]